MNGLTAHSQYKASLNRLMVDVFSFTFEEWHSLGVWNEDYECWSMLDDNSEVVSNIGVYKMRLQQNGEAIDVIQLGGVSTRPEYRGQGLQRRLMEALFDTYPDKPAFLFADNEVLDFYPRFGFSPSPHYQPFINVNEDDRSASAIDNYTVPKLKPLELGNPAIARYIANRKPFSARLDYIGTEALVWFHILANRGHIFELPRLGAMVVMTKADDVMWLHDIFSPELVHWRSLVDNLPLDGISRVEFGFNPDWLGVPYLARDANSDNLMVRNGFSLSLGTKVPSFAVT